MTVVVDTPYLEQLALWQDAASKQIASAKQQLTGTKDSSPDVYAKKLRWDHGPICNETVEAIKKALQERRKSANNMNQISDELSKRLKKGATDYGDTDTQSAENLDQQML